MNYGVTYAWRTDLDKVMWVKFCETFAGLCLQIKSLISQFVCGHCLPPPYKYVYKKLPILFYFSYQN